MKSTLSLRASALASSAAGSDTAARKEQRTERKMQWGAFMRKRFTKRPGTGAIPGNPIGEGTEKSNGLSRCRWARDLYSALDRRTESCRICDKMWVCRKPAGIPYPAHHAEGTC